MNHLIAFHLLKDLKSSALFLSLLLVSCRYPVLFFTPTVDAVKCKVDEVQDLYLAIQVVKDKV
jgi:hypothetical protein